MQKKFKTLGDMMSNAVIVVNQEQDFSVIEKLMKEKNIRHIMVVDGSEHLVGLISYRDLLKFQVDRLANASKWETNQAFECVKVKDVMGKKIRTASPDMPIEQAAKVIFNTKNSCLPIVKQGKPIGIVTEADFVRASM
jgi:CBS domain-containing protein